MHNKILKFVVFFVLLFSTIERVNASELVEVQEEGVYYVRRGGEEKYFSAPFMNYYIDGLTTYCIEPGTRITSQEYIKEDGLVNSPYSKELNDKLELIGYYGYDYPTHKTTRYKMATQALIWETINSDFIVDFWTQQYGHGEAINVDKEKKEIMNLVNSHYEVPAIPGYHEIGTMDSLFIEDEKGILHQFEIIDNGGLDTYIDGNTLYINEFYPTKTEIVFAKKRYTNNPSNLFVGKDETTQKMAYFGLTTPFTFKIIISVPGGKVTVQKLDKDTLSKITRGDASLAGTKFYLYNANNKLLDEIVIGEDSTGISKELKMGRYYLVEEKAGNGYILDETKYYFDIYEEMNPTVTIYNKAIEKNLEILKLLGNPHSGIVSSEANVTFDVYLKRTMEKVDSFTTDENGYGRVTLPYGTYIIRQETTTPGYELAEDFEIVIDENSEDIIKRTIVNNVQKYKVRVTKVDGETKKIIKLNGIKFKIKNLDTNEYICENPECIYETHNGMFTTSYLNVGNYALEEIENQIIPGYYWNSTPLLFSITPNENFQQENNDFVLEVNFSNNPVKGKIQIKKWGEKIVYDNNNFHYEKDLLDNIEYSLFADEDIYYNNELIYKKDSLVGTYITKDGIIEINNLYLGKYYLKETKTLDNYLLDDKKYSFEITTDNQYDKLIEKEFEFNNYLKKGTLKLLKVDKDSKVPLKGVTIEIYDYLTKELVYQGITNENGEIVLDNLYLGKFYIIEKEPLTGYVLKEDAIDFALENNQDVIEITIENEKIKGQLHFLKKDKNTNEVLDNILIAIYDNNSKLVYQGYTDINGQINIELDYGNYYIMEKETKDGYILYNGQLNFEIKNNHEIIELTMYNEKEPNVKEDFVMPKTSSNNFYIYLTISSINIILGLILIKYAKKKMY